MLPENRFRCGAETAPNGRTAPCTALPKIYTALQCTSLGEFVLTAMEISVKSHSECLDTALPKIYQYSSLGNFGLTATEISVKSHSECTINVYGDL